MADWQPIDTAPKDGTEVFVWAPADSLFPTAAMFKSCAYWEHNYEDPDYMPEGWYWCFGYPRDFHEQAINPTHWIPLPPPPNEDQRG